MSDNRIRLFEGDVLLRGKHSAYVKFLVNDAKIFDKYIDVYLCGAVVGYLYNVKAPRIIQFRIPVKYMLIRYLSISRTVCFYID